MVGIISPPPLPDWNSLHSIHFRFRFQNCRNTKLTGFFILFKSKQLLMRQGNLTRKKCCKKVIVIFAFKEISTYQIFVKRIFGETQGWKKIVKFFQFTSVLLLLNPWAPAGKRGASKYQTAVLRVLYRSLQSTQPAPTKGCLKVRISSDDYGPFSSQRNIEHFLGKCPCHQSYKKKFV